jgi:hypothetical protein
MEDWDSEVEYTLDDDVQETPPEAFYQALQQALKQLAEQSAQNSSGTY